MTTPSGMLLWGQGGNYDAIEDRMVVSALASRTGMVSAPTVTALTGLTVGIGPWQAIVSCGDGTMAVIGSRTQQQVALAAGGAQARTDVLWADIDPPRGTWNGTIYPQGGTAGRLGALIATITVPAGANSAAAMTLTAAQAGSGGGRGLLGRVVNNEGGVRGATTWETATGAAVNTSTPAIDIRPGNWYRIRGTAISPLYESGSSLEGRIGVGSRLDGEPQAAGVLLRASSIMWRGTGRATHAEVEHVYRRAPTNPAERRIFEVRLWCHSNGSMRWGVGGGHGDYVMLTVEDLGG